MGRCSVAATAPQAAATRGRTLVTWTLAGVCSWRRIAIAGFGSLAALRDSRNARPWRVSIAPHVGQRSRRRPRFLARRPAEKKNAAPTACRCCGCETMRSGQSRVLPGTEECFSALLVARLPRIGDSLRGLAAKRVSAAGGPVRVVADNVSIFGGAGGTVGCRRHDCVQRPGQVEIAWSAEGGRGVLPSPKLPGEDWAHNWPSFLPDGRRFLFTAEALDSASGGQ